jgi:hypothetical protein
LTKNTVFPVGKHWNAKDINATHTQQESMGGFADQPGNIIMRKNLTPNEVTL